MLLPYSTVVGVTLGAVVPKPPRPGGIFGVGVAVAAAAAAGSEVKVGDKGEMARVAALWLVQPAHGLVIDRDVYDF